MQRSVNAVNSGQMGWLCAATTFGVPQDTLRRRGRDKNETICGVMKDLGLFNQRLEKILSMNWSVILNCSNHDYLD